MPKHAIWTVPREWSGQTGFIIAGGPSVTQEDVDRLKGRNVVAINSSFEKAPWAPYLFFGDSFWWRQRGHQEAVDAFAGRAVTIDQATFGPRLLHLEKLKPPPALTRNPMQLAMHKTSLAAGINLEVHLGVNRIVLLGADGGPAADGKSHHYKPVRPVKPEAWEKQLAELRAMAEPLARLGIRVLNTSPNSRIDWWPKVRLEDCL